MLRRDIKYFWPPLISSKYLLRNIFILIKLRLGMEFVPNIISFRVHYFVKRLFIYYFDSVLRIPNGVCVLAFGTRHMESLLGGCKRSVSRALLIKHVYTYMSNEHWAWWCSPSSYSTYVVALDLSETERRITVATATTKSYKSEYANAQMTIVICIAIRMCRN